MHIYLHLPKQVCAILNETHTENFIICDHYYVALSLLSASMERQEDHMNPLTLL